MRDAPRALKADQEASQLEFIFVPDQHDVLCQIDELLVSIMFGSRR